MASTYLLNSKSTQSSDCIFHVQTKSSDSSYEIKVECKPKKDQPLEKLEDTIACPQKMVFNYHLHLITYH